MADQHGHQVSLSQRAQAKRQVILGRQEGSLSTLRREIPHSANARRGRSRRRSSARRHSATRFASTGCKPAAICDRCDVPPRWTRGRPSCRWRAGFGTGRQGSFASDGNGPAPTSHDGSARGRRCRRAIARWRSSDYGSTNRTSNSRPSWSTSSAGRGSCRNRAWNERPNRRESGGGLVRSATLGRSIWARSRRRDAKVDRRRTCYGHIARLA
jgi:hypothetical protein